jgi:arsenate reductase-like glutaredoxin family protein
MWCKKGKRWLENQGYQYSYLDIDKIPIEEKNLLKTELERTFDVRPKFPFLVVNKSKCYSGYHPDGWEEMLK